MSGSRRPNRLVEWLAARNRANGHGETDPDVINRTLAASRARSFAWEDGVIVEFAPMRDGEPTSLWVTARVTGHDAQVVRIERSVGVATTVDLIAESWGSAVGDVVESLRQQAVTASTNARRP